MNTVLVMDIYVTDFILSRGDLIAVADNPLEEIERLNSVDFVMKGGEVVLYAGTRAREQGPGGAAR